MSRDRIRGGDAAEPEAANCCSKSESLGHFDKLGGKRNERGLQRRRDSEQAGVWNTLLAPQDSPSDDVNGRMKRSSFARAGEITAMAK